MVKQDGDNMPVINGKYVDKNSYNRSLSKKTEAVMSAQAGVDPNAELRARAAALMMANPKQYSAIKAIYEMQKVPELSAAQQADAEAKANVERIIKQLEDFYLKNKLYYGNNMKGVLGNTIIPIIDPNSPASKYKAILESSGAFLAKAAGDSGNIAYQEQLLSRKPFPTTRFTKKSAMESFEEMRTKFGLPKRNYDEILNDKAKKVGLQSLGVQFGGK